MYRAFVIFLALALGLLTVSARAQTEEPTPRPSVPPEGEFSVSPSAGPIGTVVTLTGHLNQSISMIYFHCAGDGVEAFGGLTLPNPSPDFSSAFQIPAQMAVRQPRQTDPSQIQPSPSDQCEFRAISWHQLLFASTPFAVTAGLPPAGSVAPQGGSAWWPLLGLLAGGSVVLATGWAIRRVRPP